MTLSLALLTILAVVFFTTTGLTGARLRYLDGQIRTLSARLTALETASEWEVMPGDYPPDHPEVDNTDYAQDGDGRS